MDSNNTTLERHMQESLKSLLAHYQAIDVLVDQMLEKRNRGEAFAAEMARLEDAKKQIVTIETEAKGIRDRYQAEIDRPSIAVKQLTEQSTTLLLGTIKKIEVLETSTKEAQQKLMPQIGQSARASQMQNAYRAY